MVPLIPAWRKRPGGFLPCPLLARADAEGVLYVHIPKTGGTSVTRTLYGQDVGHRPWYEIRLFHPLRYRHLTTFAVVREPIDRFLSSYDYLRGGGRNPMDAAFSAKYLAPYANADDFIAAMRDKAFRDEVMAYFHFCPQAYFVATKRRCKVNRLARFDHLEVDLSSIFGRHIELPLLNRTAGARTRATDLSPASIETLNSIYEADFRLWNFAMRNEIDCYGQKY